MKIIAWCKVNFGKIMNLQIMDQPFFRKEHKDVTYYSKALEMAQQIFEF